MMAEMMLKSYITLSACKGGLGCVLIHIHVHTKGCP